ncbi:TetR/AcrR family transcriptional regulator [Nakamurella deserti]|uniref:TetR/AcrR family transcriptional regulator n=1 Tax=Nakamurella deserti TaxID=2164074 RepID=UPI000DBE68E3|nr:TetR/AcrR family transcriptional regulator [Nakamurella deserti]
MIIESARTLIADQGLSATTMRDVARAGDVALGTVTYHFAGIDEVLAGVLAEEMVAFSAPVTSAAADAATGAAGLDLLIDGLVGSDDRAREHWHLWLDFWALASHVPRYGEWQSEIYRDLHDLVARLLARGAADGTLRVVDPARQAIEFVALLDGLVVQSYLPHPRLPAAQAREILRAYGRS